MNIEPFTLPLATPLATAAGDIDERRGFLVTVQAPASGLGEACPLAGWTESLSACRRALEELPDAPDPDGLDSLPPAARHGVVLALLDAAASEAGRPLYQHLGRDERVASVPVNATVGDGAPAKTAEQVGVAVADGFETVKLKIGARSLRADLERVRTVRDRHPDVRLRLDANGAWDRETATEAFDALASLDVAYVEQPLAAEDLAGHATLRDGPVGVAIDEGLYEHDLETVLTTGAADAVVLKPMAMGGPDVALEAAVLARDAGVDPVVTTTVDGPLARAAAVHVAAALPDVAPCGLATGDRVAGTRHDPAPVVEGRARVPQQEGNAPATSPADYA
ncbi:mandelate racemase/muconate lactonizing enzyme family protein [Halosegnis sp.]|uniref:mandelate racemase/muconate lactonizing enzyme family protein n=1 Tax=Halosegnis sp. TaxID=2864959 RepID=UPI0035D45FD1